MSEQEQIIYEEMNKQRAELRVLYSQYNAMPATERESQKGRQIISQIKDLNEKIAELERQIPNNNRFSSLGTYPFKIGKQERLSVWQAIKLHCEFMWVKFKIRVRNS